MVDMLNKVTKYMNADKAISPRGKTEENGETRWLALG